jgi:organic hydroperoxide reductase OsmC/OhrA
MSKNHEYNISVRWTGNTGNGTAGYKGYERSHTVQAPDKTEILCSSDSSFRGDKTKYNPEELLVASISTCHMLWYLHLCADAGIIVTAYHDNATGIMQETENGGGYFKEITLYPQVIVKDDSMVEKASSLHAKANELCFIANSVKFPVHHKPTCTIA